MRWLPFILVGAACAASPPAEDPSGQPAPSVVAPSACEVHLARMLDDAAFDLELHLMPSAEISELIGAELPGVGTGVGGTVHFLRFEITVPNEPGAESVPSAARKSRVTPC